MLTPERIAAINARADAATCGPWKFDKEKNDVYFRMRDGSHYGQVAKPGTHGDLEEMEFIAHARQDVPDLLAEVERLQSALDAAEKSRAERDKVVWEMAKVETTAAALAANWGVPNYVLESAIEELPCPSLTEIDAELARQKEKKL